MRKGGRPSPTDAASPLQLHLPGGGGALVSWGEILYTHLHLVDIIAMYTACKQHHYNPQLNAAFSSSMYFEHDYLSPALLHAERVSAVHVVSGV